MTSSEDFLAHFAPPPYIEIFYKSNDNALLSASAKIDTETNEIVYDHPEGFDWIRNKESEIKEKVISLKHETEHGKKTILVISQNGIIQVYKNIERDFIPS